MQLDLPTGRLSGVVTLLLAALLLSSTSSHAQDASRTLSLSDFIQLATRNDTRFEAILLDRMPLKYRRAASLPDQDILFSLKQQLHYIAGTGIRGDSQLALSRLFPATGTRTELSYRKSATISEQSEASLQLLLAQPIAQNAYGRSFELADKLIGIENDISRYQIIEAYEDYLASLTVVWYNWYAAWENLKVSQASYQSSEKLLQNILERKRQKIALAIDVNKMQLALTEKRENMLVLQEIYAGLSNHINSAIRNNQHQAYIPGVPAMQDDNVEFKRDFNQFQQTSRTWGILKLLAQQQDIEINQAADSLLPSTDLLLGYQLDGEQWGIRPEQNSFFAGIALSWPIGKTVDRADYEIKKIERKKTLLANENKLEALRTSLKNLYLQIQRERKLIRVAKEKIRLAEAILKDERENYSYGKVSLNDYITAVNNVDRNRFSQTDHQVKLNKLLLEWRRLTDVLVTDLPPDPQAP